MDGSHSQALAVVQDSVAVPIVVKPSRMRVCEHCHAEFKAHRPCEPRRYCSRKCSAQSNGRMSGEWTAERIAKLCSLHNEGLSAEIIARRMMTSRNSILGKIWRLRNPSVSAPKHKVVRSPHVPTSTMPKRQHVRKPERSLVVSLPTRAPEGRLAPLCASFSPIVARQLGTPAILVERHPQGCCRPINDGSPFRYCNNHRLAGIDYCPDCYGKMYTPLPPRKLSQWIKWR